MTDILKKIVSPDFNAEKYVRELTQQCVGGQELQQQKQKIQSLSDETSNTLKKNVYENYMEFIETAKEISHLESEMYQLSHLLSEQRTLLGALGSTSILGGSKDPLSQGDVGGSDSAIDEAEEQEDQRNSELESITSRVDGLPESLDVPGRTLLHEGDLLELDPLDHGPQRRIHFYLFNDALMIAMWMPARRGPVRYQFDSLYLLRALAVVNARDLGPVQHAIKLLVFPDTRVMQCTSQNAKIEWLEKFEIAKRAQRTGEDPKRSQSLRSHSLSEDTPSEFLVTPSESEDSPPPDWLQEAPDELQVLVAQRHFEDALALLQRAQDYLESCHPLSIVLLDIKNKVEECKCSLAEVLMAELAVPQGRSLQGALRAARRAVKLLVMLERPSQACDLFLKLSSNALRGGQRRARREGPGGHIGSSVGGNLSSPAAKLAELFFCDLAEVAREFLRAFQNVPACASAFVVWSGVELGVFVGHLVKHWMSPGTPLPDIAVCVDAVRKPCHQLTELGLDLGYRLEGLLRHSLEKALHEWRQRLCDSVISRTEERWRPLNLHTKQALKSLLKEMDSIGINLQPYITGDTWIALSPSNITFCKLFVGLGVACGTLGATIELRPSAITLLTDLFSAHMKVQPPANEKIDASFIQKNRSFLLEVVLPLVTSKFEKATGVSCSALRALMIPTKSYSTEYI